MRIIRECILGVLIAAAIAIAACKVEGADLGSPIPKDELTLLREQNDELLKQVAEIKATLAKLTAPVLQPVAAKETPAAPKQLAPAVARSVQYLTMRGTTARTGSSGPMAKVKSALGCSSSGIATTTLATGITYTLAPNAGPVGGTTIRASDCPPGIP